MAILFIFFYFLFMAITVAMYLFESIGIYRMSKNMGFNGWLAFVPFAKTYAYGKIAETYVKANGKPSAKFSKILLAFHILMVALSTVFLFLAIFMFVMDGIKITPEGFGTDIESFAISALAIPLVLVYFAMYATSVAFSVINFVAIWRIYALYDYNHATSYLILSIFCVFLYPIFFFVLRNKEPKFTMEQRLNIQPNIQQ